MSDGSNAPRQGLGSFFRNLVDFIAERGLVNEVLARVSPEIRSIWEKPPRPLSRLASFEGPGTPRAAFLVLQGSLQFAFELCGVSGEVGPPEVLADALEGACVRYRVRWN